MKSNNTLATITLARITISHNPRCPIPDLTQHREELGYDDWTAMDFIHQLALSDDPTDRATFCKLIEKYENDPVDGIIALAESRRQVEIQPINLRAQHGSIDDRTYGVISGERRVIAAAYNYAKHNEPAEIEALVGKITVADGIDIAWEENRRRRQPSLMETAAYFHERMAVVKGTKNEATGRNWTMKDVASAVREDYQEFRRTEALVYLPEGDQKRLNAGTLGKVNAMEKALRIKSGKASQPADDKKTDRRRVGTLKQVEAMFDGYREKQSIRTMDSPGGPVVLANITGAMQALAAVMGITVAVANRESTKREKEAEKDAAQEAA